jgi:pyruvate-ferredoxin/flavodoxin oxidoreductase
MVLAGKLHNVFCLMKRVAAQGKNPLKLDIKAPKIKFEEYAYMETRYKMLTKSHTHEAKELMKLAQQDVNERWKALEELASERNGEAAKTPITPALPPAPTN